MLNVAAFGPSTSLAPSAVTKVWFSGAEIGVPVVTNRWVIDRIDRDADGRGNRIQQAVMALKLKLSVPK